MFIKKFLVGKTLKYTPDITKDIFLQILRKLESIGIKCYHKDDEAWNYFSKTHNYFANFWKSEYGFTPNKSSLEEIQVSDIIEPQFEVGKWYEIVHPNFGLGEHISKFKELTDGKFWYSERIYSGNYGKKEDWHGYYNNVRLCTLEEIQQYLPEGHPDKVSKSLTVDDLVEGDVYYHKCLQYSYIVKFKKLDGISITGEYYIDLKTNNYSKNYRNASITELRSATPSEKKWLLTCIKQDKFIKQSELDKYDDEGNLIEIKPTFEFNKWYRHTIGKGLWFIKNSNGDSYGFKGNWNPEKLDQWLDHNVISDWVNMIPATPEEVKERMLSYAKEKYPIGTKIIDVNHKKEVTVYSDYFDYYENTQHVTYGESVYLKGQWAEIISKPIKTGKGILEATEVNRNVYYEVSNQEQYNEILDWLESKGEILHKNSRNFDVTDNWKYVVFNLNLLGSWALTDNIPNLPKAEFKFKSKESHSDQVIDIMNSESKQSHRTIPTVEKVTNRFKASPVRKRSLPEIY